MHDRYEYRRLTLRSATWTAIRDLVDGAVAERTTSLGGIVVGLFTGQIGAGSDEGVLVTAWPDRDAPTSALDGVFTRSALIEGSAGESLVATVRPVSPPTITEPGVYAHRWFELAEADWPEFVQLSEEAWPSFEAANPGTEVIGFWRSEAVEPPAARVLLLTRYPSLAAWERSRTFQGPAPGVDPDLVRQAGERFLRRSELTHRTIVRTYRLAGTGPAGT